MSDNEELEVEAQLVEEEEPEFEETRSVVTQEIIAKGLQEIKKTAGKLTLYK